MDGVRQYRSIGLFQSKKGLVAFLEFLGAVAGITGALIMAISPEYSFYAWSMWLVSAISLAAFAQMSDLRWLLTLNIIYTAIDLIGLAKVW